MSHRRLESFFAAGQPAPPGPACDQSSSNSAILDDDEPKNTSDSDQHNSQEAIMKRYGLPANQIQVYVHHQPSYYHLHVHFTHLNNEAPSTLIGQAHYLEEEIDNNY